MWERFINLAKKEFYFFFCKLQPKIYKTIRKKKLKEKTMRQLVFKIVASFILGALIFFVDISIDIKKFMMTVVGFAGLLYFWASLVYYKSIRVRSKVLITILLTVLFISIVSNLIYRYKLDSEIILFISIGIITILQACVLVYIVNVAPELYANGKNRWIKISRKDLAFLLVGVISSIVVLFMSLQQIILWEGVICFHSIVIIISIRTNRILE